MNEEDDIKAKKDYTRTLSLKSTQNALGILEASENIASSTSRTLVTQREKLERTSKNLDDINVKLKDSQKNITRMKGVVHRLRNMLSPKKVQRCTLSVIPIDEEREETPKGEEPESFSTASPGEDEHAIQNYNHVFEPEDEEIENNLQAMSPHINNLKEMAMRMGTEIDCQNQLIDDIRCKAEIANYTIDSQNLQMKKLLK